MAHPELQEAEAEVRAALARLRRPDPDFAFGAVDPGDFHDLVYRCLRDLTRDMAQAAEERSRTYRRRRFAFGPPRPTRDDDYSRATWIEAHVRLMTALHPHWGARLRGEHDALLRRYPLTAAERANARRLDLSSHGLT